MTGQNEYYTPGEQRAANVNALFSAIAARYDRINDLQSLGLHRRWKRQLGSLAAVREGDAALDVCCGTGDIARELARRGARVTGLDFNEQMLKVATARPAGDAPQSIRYVRGDAMKLPFPDAAFDIVTVGYGLRNLADWEAGLSEMVRVARPGARLLALDFGKPDNALWRSLYFGYLRVCVPLFGLLFCRNAAAYAYILESLNHFPAQRGVDAHLRSLGLTDVRIHNLLGGAMSINFARKPSH
jgi:demethylmenaquinone methyltransferase / 2-methoxy-6-polyprenyl-1,4-benzoquinol methylase